MSRASLLGFLCLLTASQCLELECGVGQFATTIGLTKGLMLVKQQGSCVANNVISQRLGGTIDLGAATSAMAQVSCEFILNKTYGSLEKDDFNVAVTDMLQNVGFLWRATILPICPGKAAPLPCS